MAADTSILTPDSSAGHGGDEDEEQIAPLDAPVEKTDTTSPPTLNGSQPEQVDDQPLETEAPAAAPNPDANDDDERYERASDDDDRREYERDYTPRRARDRTVTQSDLNLFYSLVDDVVEEKEAIKALQDSDTAIDAALQYRKTPASGEPRVEEVKLRVRNLIDELEQLEDPSRNILNDSALRKLRRPLKQLGIAFKEGRAKVQGDVRDPTARGDIGVAVPRRIYYTASLDKQNWWSFSHHISSMTWDPCIEYLPQLPRNDEDEKKFQRSAGGPKSQQKASDLQEIPELLRIRSTAVVRILIDLLHGELTPPEHVTYPLDFLRPYKLLIYAETAIRQRFKELKILMDEKKAYMAECLERFYEENPEARPPPEENKEDADDNQALRSPVEQSNQEVRDEDNPEDIPKPRDYFFEAGPCPYYDSEMYTANCKMEKLTYPDLAEAYNEFALLIKFFDEQVLPRRNYVRASTTRVDKLREAKDLDKAAEEARKTETNEQAEHTIPTERDEVHIYTRREPAQPKELFFSDLWHMFEPGQFIYVKDPSIAQKIWQVVHCTGGRRIGDAKHYEVSELCIDCYYLDFDGINWLKQWRRFVISPYTGAQPSDVLRYIPFESAIEQELVAREDLMKRGAEFMSCVTETHHRDFSGISIDCTPLGRKLERANTTDLNLSRVYSRNINGQVVIDFERCLQMNPTWRETNIDSTVFMRASDREVYSEYKLIHDDSKWDTRMKSDMLEVLEEKWLAWERKKAQPQGTDLMLLTGRVFGFILRDREWASLKCTGSAFKLVPSRRQAWNELMIPSEHKDIVQSLIEARFDHEDAAQNEYDLIRDKGKGLIVLLHGAPGVGKTSTAECVAEYYQKPLIPITCGDLGLVAEQVEARLRESLQLAQAWDCVMLLDEADVFLATRSVEDIQRNALVSVFLRVLEYYEGILFLTTNRVGTFDEAFKSRIHMSLHYDSLDWNQTEAIWKSQMKRAREHKPPVECNELSLLAFAKNLFDNQTADPDVHGPVWNGRQIRNGFQSAIAMAKRDMIELLTQDKPGEGYKLTMVRVKDYHFDKVARVAKDFNTYMTEVKHNKPDAWWAKANMYRVDNYNAKHAKPTDNRMPHGNPYGGSFPAGSSGQQYGRDQYGRDQYSESSRPQGQPQDQRGYYDSMPPPGQPSGQGQRTYDSRTDDFRPVQRQRTFDRPSPQMDSLDARRSSTYIGAAPSFAYGVDAAGGAAPSQGYGQQH